MNSTVDARLLEKPSSQLAGPKRSGDGHWVRARAQGAMIEALIYGSERI